VRIGIAAVLLVLAVCGIWISAGRFMVPANRLDEAGAPVPRSTSESTTSSAAERQSEQISSVLLWTEDGTNNFRSQLKSIQNHWDHSPSEENDQWNRDLGEVSTKIWLLLQSEGTPLEATDSQEVSQPLPKSIPDVERKE
jgi:hypothetical protein